MDDIFSKVRIDGVESNKNLYKNRSLTLLHRLCYNIFGD